MTMTLRKCPGLVFKATKKSFVLQEVVCPRRESCLRYFELDKLIKERNLTEVSFLSPKEVYPMCEDYLTVPPEVTHGTALHQGTSLSRKLG